MCRYLFQGWLCYLNIKVKRNTLFPIASSLMLETTPFSGMLVTSCQTTRRHIRRDGHLSHFIIHTLYISV
jgi:hypothetical protein